MVLDSDTGEFLEHQVNASLWQKKKRKRKASCFLVYCHSIAIAYIAHLKLFCLYIDELFLLFL
jgi:hypothetical protein